MEIFQKAAGLKMTDAPYKGAAPAVTDLLGGHVSAMIVSTGLIAPYVAAGQVRVLAVGAPKRSPLLPDVPTAGTPREVISRLNSEVGKILNDPAFRSENLAKYDLEVVGGSPEQLAAFIKTETVKWGAVIREAKVRLD